MDKYLIKTPQQIESICAAGQILAEVLAELQKSIKIGVSLLELDGLARELTLRRDARPAFLGYRPDGASRRYPAALCTSVNAVIVHGVPTEYRLKNGDVLSIDFGVVKNGFFADAATTAGVGAISRDSIRLIEATRTALAAVIPYMTPASTLGDLGWIIADTARRHRVRVAEGLTGHGIGFNLHEPPLVLNDGVRGRGERLVPGMVLAVEPMFVLGDSAIRQLQDESWATADGSLAAHFEHTIAVTKAGPRVLTSLSQ